MYHPVHVTRQAHHWISAVFCVAYASPPCNVLHTCGTQRVVHHWVPQKGGGTTGGWLLTNVAKLEPMARSCAYFLIWFAVARATAAAHACAVYAVCVGVINVL